MADKLIKRIEFAKTCLLPQRELYKVHGEINMAFELKAITPEEFFRLNHECVANGINNPKYFDKN